LYKRRDSEKHKTYYVYGIDTTWRDGSAMIVWRRYSAFRQLHLALKSSVGDAAALPELPGRTVLNTESVAMGRVAILNKYLAAVLSSPELTLDEALVTFLDPVAQDINPQVGPQILRAAG